MEPEVNLDELPRTRYRWWARPEGPLEAATRLARGSPGQRRAPAYQAARWGANSAESRAPSAMEGPKGRTSFRRAPLTRAAMARRPPARIPRAAATPTYFHRSEEHTSELQSRE